MPSRLRIFVSSPSDVREERLRAQLTIQKLARDYAAHVQLIPYFWESEPLRATGHFQDDIEPPSTHDIVVLILWARLGTPLPPQTSVREYKGIDGRAPVTGTEWEFEDALASYRTRHAPDLLACRRSGDPGTSLINEARKADQEQQWRALQAFWARYFENKGEFLAASSRYSSLDEFDAKLEGDLAKLIERRLRAQVARPGDGEVFHLKGPPYRGLSTYDFEDAPVFFGRDGAVRTALTRLMAAAEGGMAFLLVLGASGAGKSSLARAGLLPALVAAKAVPGVGLWRRVVMRPGDTGQDPVAALARALLAGDIRAGEGLPELAGPGIGIEELARHLRASASDPSFPFRNALRALADTERNRRGLLAHEEARLVLVIDQLEELFTHPSISDADRTSFAQILAGLARCGLVWVIATMRSDLWHRVCEVPTLLDITEAGSRLDLLPPDGAELLELVRRPTRAVGLGFDEDPETNLGLDAVLADAAAAEPGALPLLSVLLEDLYRRDVLDAGVSRPARLTFASYRALGELKGAIATRAETVYRRIEEGSPDVAATLPSLLRAMVTTSVGAAVTSRPARLADFPPGPTRTLIDALAASDSRLLTLQERDGEVEARLAHEALIAHWPRAAKQLERDRRDIETRARLEGLLKAYQNAPARRKGDALISGLSLEEGVDLVARWRIAPATPLGAFVDASQRRHRASRQRGFALAAALVLVFAGIAAGAGLQWREAARQSETARTAERIAQAGRAAAAAREAIVREDPLLAISIAVRALKAGAPLSWETTPELCRVILDAEQKLQLLNAIKGRFLASAISKDGNTIALLSKDRLAFYNASNGAILAQPINVGTPNEGDVQIAISEDGRRAAVRSSQLISFYDASKGKALSSVGCPDRLYQMFFLSTERFLAFCKNKAVVLAPSSGHQLYDVEIGLEEDVYYGVGPQQVLSYDAKHHLLASPHEIRNADDGHVVLKLAGGAKAYLPSSTFSPSGNLLAVDMENSVDLWSISQKRRLASVPNLAGLAPVVFDDDQTLIGISNTAAKTYDISSKSLNEYTSYGSTLQQQSPTKEDLAYQRSFRMPANGSVLFIANPYGDVSPAKGLTVVAKSGHSFRVFRGDPKPDTDFSNEHIDGPFATIDSDYVYIWRSRLLSGSVKLAEAAADNSRNTVYASHAGADIVGGKACRAPTECTPVNLGQYVIVLRDGRVRSLSLQDRSLRLTDSQGKTIASQSLEAYFPAGSNPRLTNITVTSDGQCNSALVQSDRGDRLFLIRATKFTKLELPSRAKNISVDASMDQQIFVTSGDRRFRIECGTGATSEIVGKSEIRSAGNGAFVVERIDIGDPSNPSALKIDIYRSADFKLQRSVIIDINQENRDDDYDVDVEENGKRNLLGEAVFDLHTNKLLARLDPKYSKYEFLPGRNMILGSKETVNGSLGKTSFIDGGTYEVMLTTGPVDNRNSVTFGDLLEYLSHEGSAYLLPDIKRSSRELTELYDRTDLSFVR